MTDSNKEASDFSHLQCRHVRLWSDGNHIGPSNDYTEVDVFGRPGA